MPLLWKKEDICIVEQHISPRTGTAPFRRLITMKEEPGNKTTKFMNAKFTFVSLLGLMLVVGAKAQKPQVSDEQTTTWYCVASASAGGSSGLVMGDDADAAPAYPVALQAADGSQRQQWKLVDGGSGLLRLVNRATGRILQPVSEAATLYNIVQLQSSVIEGRGFSLQDLGSGQYALGGAEADGVTRYLLSACQDEAPAAASSLTAGSAFAWTFADASTVGIKDAVAQRPTVSVRNGRVEVTPSVPYTVTSADGVPMPAGRKLSAGVYVVAGNGFTAKVIVNP